MSDFIVFYVLLKRLGVSIVTVTSVLAAPICFFYVANKIGSKRYSQYAKVSNVANM